MTVGIDATGTLTDAAGGPASPFNNTSLTIGTGLSNSALIVLVIVQAGAAWPGAATVAMTWGGAAMTLIGRQQDATPSAVVELWGRLAPASGNQTLAYTFSGGGAPTEVGTIPVSLTGVNQTSIAAAFANFTSLAAATANPSRTVTGAAGDMAFGLFATTAAGDITPFTSPAGVTQLFHQNANNINAIGGRAPGAASVIFTATAVAEAWTGAGVDVVAAAAAASCAGQLMLMGVGCGIAAKKLEENPILTRRSLLLPRRRSLMGHNGGPPLDE